MNPPAKEGSITPKNATEYHTPAAADLAADLLRREILTGQHYSGEQLRETHIAARLNLSRNTVREAYRKLEAEGLVTHIPHRGVYVASYNEERIRQLYAFRRVTECGTICSLSVTEAAELAKTLTGLYSEPSNNKIATADRNNEFHSAIVAASGSPELTKLTESIFAQLRLCFMAYPDTDALHSRFERYHRELIDKLEQGETKAAAEFLEHYLKESFKTLQESFNSASD
ncbi:MAG: GntR family transcriptional regulator [Corynebacterium sp.]|uniref:GntR family transcriptional regulator n=1 Tax=Corynebacterium sp. TaxID=1720 RepID=UPI0026DD031E|nr:GntR family transcriptional regulator [Corynebacterium sp.]MDO5030819.1 GntR family transcriptional regulator [Corynebacterium sp.]